MDVEKACALAATNDGSYLTSDTFVQEGAMADLYLYPHELRILTRTGERIIPIDFDLTFSIITDNEEPIGIELNTHQERIQLLREFWPRAGYWEDMLIGCVKRKSFHEFFTPVKQIGRGNFATVYLAVDNRRAQMKVAVKAFKKEVAYRGDGKHGIANEIRLMREIDCEHVVKLHGVYETTNSLYLSMEYVKGSNLESFLRRHRHPVLEQRKKVLRAMLIALKELRKLKIVHRDIKPENIMVSEDLETVKLVDLGLATHIDAPYYIFVRCGTPGFVAPEILKIRDQANVRLGVECDMFSLGAIYFRMLYGRSLFPGKDQAEVLNSNRSCHIRLEQAPCCDPEEIDLLRQMLCPDPESRIKPEEALRHRLWREKRTTRSSSRKVLGNLENFAVTGDCICIED